MIKKIFEGNVSIKKINDTFLPTCFKLNKTKMQTKLPMQTLTSKTNENRNEIYKQIHRSGSRIIKTLSALLIHLTVQAIYFFSSAYEIRSKWHGESQKKLKRI